MGKLVRIGARGSELSRYQAGVLGKILEGEGFEAEYHWIKNTGDIDLTSSLYSGGEGVFVDAINSALLKGDIDVAVHSAKDLPGDYDQRLDIAFVSRRGDPRDTLVSPVKLGELLPGSVIGTSSLRRRFQLLDLRRDLDVRDLRGNIGTRIDKIGHQYHGILMALAAIERLHIGAANHPFSADELVPAPNQGFIIGMTRTGYGLDFLHEMNQSDRAVLELERYSMNFLGLGCSKPIGIMVTGMGKGYVLRLKIYNGNGIRTVDIREEFRDMESLKSILSEVRERL